MSKRKTKLALFDLDGTLFDTGVVNYCAYRDALSPYGISLDREYFQAECNGRHYTEFLPVIMGTEEYLEPVHSAKKEAYAKNLHQARMNKPLFDLIRGIRKDYHCAVVTTASRRNAAEILSRFQVEDLFDLLIAQEDITKVKPDPQGFLLAMEHFGIGKKNTVIFEDSGVGIQAARASGAAVFVVNQF